jgi:aspartyl-tRNA(Asn)/glutamyl-tRNA(Gln) amidotransferase subunit A
LQPVELASLTVARAGAAIRARELSPLEITEAYLARIERLNPAVNAYVTVTAERALADARRATNELAAGIDRGPLHGVPIALKDLFDTAGIETAGGAKVYAGRVPARDSTVAAALAGAGAVLLGKLNTHELAFGATTTNPHTGATRNPWNLERVPGGSSGGSGAAIAAGLAAATMGTDTGGSVRIPASLCGCVGLKPTYGRVSKAGVMPLSFVFDHPGPLTHTVEDAAIVLDAIAGYDPADPATVPVPVPDHRAALGAGVAGLRVGVPRGYFFDLLDDEVRAAVEAALAVFRSLGAELRDLELPGVDMLVRALNRVVLVEAQQIHAEVIVARPDDLGEDVRGLLTTPAPGTARVFESLSRVYDGAAAFRRALESVDVLVTPTTPVPAPPIGARGINLGGRDEPVGMTLLRCTAPFNATWLPALSLPCGFTAAGLPIGLQIAGRPFDEATVLRAGHAYEQATDWHRRRPAG